VVRGGGGGPFQDYEDINCPRCGALWGQQKTGGVFVTAIPTPEEEAEHARFRERYGKLLDKS
jgi:hypothetical protein